jgi:putative transposase
LTRSDEAILGVARENPTDGTRMVAALASRDLGRRVNRKRVQRLMREHRLLQRHRPRGRRRRPGFFRVQRPDQLWHMDMTSVWVAEHGWCYLNAAIDCCTREITGWALDVRCRAVEATAVVDAAVAARQIRPGELTLGTDNGTALTARAFRARLAEHGIVHRRGGYRDPESQAFIESWFSKLKERCVWREEFETLEQARHGDRRLHRRLPPPAPLRAGLPNAARGRGYLERSRRPANPRGLTVNGDGVQARTLPQGRHPQGGTDAARIHFAPISSIDGLLLAPDSGAQARGNRTVARLVA